MTTSPNLDLVRSILADWERGDFSSADWAHPQIEFIFADGPTPGGWTGLPEMATGMRDWLSAWEDLRIAADEYREVDDDCVVVLVRFGGRGRTSGLEIGQVPTKNAALFRTCDGKVTKLVVYWDRDRALADLGLTPEGGSPDS